MLNKFLLQEITQTYVNGQTLEVDLSEQEATLIPGDTCERQSQLLSHHSCKHKLLDSIL